MIQNKKLGSWSGRQAAAILSVSETQPSRFADNVLARLDAGSLTYEEAKAEILKRANVTYYKTLTN
jgi:hypothetical protein